MAARSIGHSNGHHDENEHKQRSNEHECREDACPAPSRGRHDQRHSDHGLRSEELSYALDDSLSIGYALPVVPFQQRFAVTLPPNQSVVGAAAPTSNISGAAPLTSTNNNYKYYMVIVTAEDCPACSNFKQKTLDRLLAELQVKNYGVEHIHLPSTSADLPTQYPSMLESLVVFFPCLILVQGKSWESAKRNRNERFGARVFNTVRTARGIEPRPKSSALPTTPGSIKAWISSIVDQDVSLSMQL